jgi:hypothetical protein
MGLFSKRQKARGERKANRQAARTERTRLRQETKQTAYASGVNPNAFISDIVGTAGQVATGILGGGGGDNTQQDDKKLLDFSSGPSTMQIALGGLAVVAVLYFVTKKK